MLSFATLPLVTTLPIPLFASENSAVLKIDDNNKYLRWELFIEKDKLVISKNENLVLLETFDLSYFDRLVTTLQAQQVNKKYFSIIKYNKEFYPQRPAQIQLYLSNSTVELFKFYKETNKKVVLDFWINEATLNQNKIAEINPGLLNTGVQIQKINAVPNLNSNIPQSDSINKQSNLVEDFVGNKSVFKIFNRKNGVSEDDTDKAYAAEENSRKKLEFERQKKLEHLTVAVDRVSLWQSAGRKSMDNSLQKNKLDLDFRYGASFLWAYPMIPVLSNVDIDLESKSPDFYYPILNREKKIDNREGHLQLMINFYRKNKFGLMKKSIDLFEAKYKATKDELVLFEYLEANVLSKSYISTKNPGLLSSYMGKIDNIINLTNDFSLKKVLYRFLIQEDLNKKNYLSLLERGKDFFIKANENKDREMIYLSAKSIMFSLSELNQVDKLEKFMSDKDVSPWLDTQEGLSFQFLTLFKREEFNKVLSIYEAKESGMEKPIKDTILFLVAESYFQLGEIDLAEKTFKHFLKSYQYHSYASFARIRYALCRELSGATLDEVGSLYLDAINRATLPTARLEAKLRYVGALFNRKGSVTTSDKKMLAYLDTQADEEKYLVYDVKFLLWQVRLRSLIKQKKYSEALTYYTSIPLDAMPKAYQSVFERDGTEVVLGLMQEAFHQGDDGRVLKLWGIYNTKFNGNLKMTKQALYYAGSSSMKLGLKQNSEALLELYKTQGTESFPQWVDREFTDLDMSALELRQLIGTKKFDEAQKIINEVKENSPLLAWAKVLIQSSKKNYPEMQKLIEETIIDEKLMKGIIPSDLVDILENYLTALEVNEKGDRLEKRLMSVMPVFEANIDTFKRIKERAKFILLESYMSGKEKKWFEIENVWNDFAKEYGSSSYLPRLVYGKAIYLIKENRGPEAKIILRKLATSDETPVHIKEMAKNELNTFSEERKM